MSTQPRRTRNAKSTATEFAHASVAGRVHDADLCERIRALEKEVEDLKRDRHHCHHFPQWTWTYPVWHSGTSITYTGTTTGDLTTGTIVTYDS